MPELKSHPKDSSARPDIFTFHDYRAFLKEWLGYLKKQRGSDFSLRKIALSAGFASGFLPMVLSCRRHLSLDSAAQLAPLILLSPSEQGYFENLVRLATSSKGQKAKALSKLARSRTYKKRNPQEVEFLRYMSNWYYVAIREMAALPGFKPEPEWIRERLHPKVPGQMIQQALDFLFQHGYLARSADGTISPPKESLDCAGPVYSGALTQYHQQMFAIAADAIENVAPREKHVVGYTFALAENQFDRLKKILDHALDQIEELEKENQDSKESVYQVELAAFPLARDKRKKP